MACRDFIHVAEEPEAVLRLEGLEAACGLEEQQPALDVGLGRAGESAQVGRASRRRRSRDRSPTWPAMNRARSVRSSACLHPHRSVARSGPVKVPGTPTHPGISTKSPEALVPMTSSQHVHVPLPVARATLALHSRWLVFAASLRCCRGAKVANRYRRPRPTPGLMGPAAHTPSRAFVSAFVPP